MTAAISARTRLARNNAPRRQLSVVRAAGAEFYDDSGAAYLDATSQTLNLLFGHCHPAIMRAVTAQLHELDYVTQELDSPLHRRAASALHAVLPVDLTAVNLRLNDGSSGVECAVKQARAATGRPTVLTFDGTYLGQTAQMMWLRGWGALRSEVLNGGAESVRYAPAPYCSAEDHDPATCPAENGTAAAALIAEHADCLACVIADPIMISSGVVVGRTMGTWLCTVQAACRRHGVAFILDESQSFGWVPDLTVTAHLGLSPDAVVLAKGVAAGLPLSICAARAELDVLQFPDADFTSGGHPASVAALIETLRLLGTRAEQDKFQQLSTLLAQRLQAETARRPWTRTRGLGLIHGVELLAGPEVAANVVDRCLAAGVYTRRYAGCVVLKPPRVMRPDQLDRVVDVLMAAVDAEHHAGAATPHPTGGH